LLDVLRKGVKDRGVRIRVAYFRPSLVLDDAVLNDYRANRLTVVRELVYAAKQADKGNRLDLTLFLNGIPVATTELKNPLTGQNVEDAKAQYRRAGSERADLHHRVIVNLNRRPHQCSSPQLRGRTRLSCRSTPDPRAWQPGAWAIS
jgi:type I restriction enzyme R subunit